MNAEFNFYRIKTEWVSEKDGGGLVKSKTEELVYAASYTEAEKVAYSIAEREDRSKFGSIHVEIVKTKIAELLYNNNLIADESPLCGLICNYFQEAEDTGVGLYAVKVMYLVIDERTGECKRTNEVIHTPASSTTQAANYVQSYLKCIGETRDFVVRDTKFDKAEAILWPPTTHENKINSAIRV